MVARRELRVRLMTRRDPNGPTRTVHYQGRALALRFGPDTP